MAYSLCTSLALGTSHTGLTDLRAQLVDSSGTNVGSAVSTGFVEIGVSGNYLWTYAAFPDGHRGGVKFYSNAAPTVFLAFVAINPEEVENTDVKTSSVAGPGVDGSVTYTYTVYQVDETTPLEGAAVYVSSDVGGTIRSATKYTDALGRVQFSLDPATYYFWRTHHAYVFVNPDTEAVS